MLGARIADFVITQGRAEFANAEGNDLRVYPGDDGGKRAAGVRERRRYGRAGGAGFLTALTFDADELVDVALEPSTNHPRW